MSLRAREPFGPIAVISAVHQGPDLVQTSSSWGLAPRSLGPARLGKPEENFRNIAIAKLLRNQSKHEPRKLLLSFNRLRRLFVCGGGITRLNFQPWRDSNAWRGGEPHFSLRDEACLHMPALSSCQALSLRLLHGCLFCASESSRGVPCF